MKAFYGGQIKKENRGELSAVIMTKKSEQIYGVFLYPVISQEFIYLTGIGDRDDLIERIYIGISRNIGENIARRANKYPIENINLGTIDDLVVIPYFLNRFNEKLEK